MISNMDNGRLLRLPFVDFCLGGNVCVLVEAGVVGLHDDHGTGGQQRDSDGGDRFGFFPLDESPIVSIRRLLGFVYNAKC